MQKHRIGLQAVIVILTVLSALGVAVTLRPRHSTKTTVLVVDVDYTAPNPGPGPMVFIREGADRRDAICTGARGLRSNGRWMTEVFAEASGKRICTVTLDASGGSGDADLTISTAVAVRLRVSGGVLADGREEAVISPGQHSAKAQPRPAATAPSSRRIAPGGSQP